MERLREAAYEGRILSHELEERLGAALSARTYGELERLTADLPAPPAPAAARSPSLRVRAAGLVTVALMLSALGSAYAPRIRTASAAGASGPGHGHVLSHTYESFSVAAPLVGLLGIVVLCALLGWLFARRSVTGDTQ